MKKRFLFACCIMGMLLFSGCTGKKEIAEVVYEAVGAESYVKCQSGSGSEGLCQSGDGGWQMSSYDMQFLVKARDLRQGEHDHKLDIRNLDDYFDGCVLLEVRGYSMPGGEFKPDGVMDSATIGAIFGHGTVKHYIPLKECWANKHESGFSFSSALSSVEDGSKLVYLNDAAFSINNISIDW